MLHLLLKYTERKSTRTNTPKVYRKMLPFIPIKLINPLPNDSLGKGYLRDNNYWLYKDYESRSSNIPASGSEKLNFDSRTFLPIISNAAIP